jgi:RNA polymerase sigma-70 factor (sigma-E family)
MNTEHEQRFVAFVEARTSALLRYARVLTGDPHRAEDLVQSALASAYRHWGRVEPDGAEAYVRQAVLNGYLSWWRRPWRGRETAVADLATLADRVHQSPAADDGLMLRDTVVRALDSLPPRQRAVLVLRYYEDLSEAEIAQRMGTSTGTVKSQASKALARLRAQLGDSAPGVLVDDDPTPELAPSGGAA